MRERLELAMSAAGPVLVTGEPVDTYPACAAVSLSAGGIRSLLTAMDATRQLEEMGELVAAAFHDMRLPGVGPLRCFEAMDDREDDSEEGLLSDLAMLGTATLLDDSALEALGEGEPRGVQTHIAPDSVWWSMLYGEADVRGYTAAVSRARLVHMLPWLLGDVEYAAFVRSLPARDPELYIDLVEGRLAAQAQAGSVPLSRPVPGVPPELLAPMLKHSDNMVREWAILRIGERASAAPHRAGTRRPRG